MSGGNSMTLAFELGALRALADPAGVVDDAREWSTYVGVVSDRPEASVANFARVHRVRRDFFQDALDRREWLTAVREEVDTERYVFVGTTPDDRRVAQATGWEYQRVEDAAEKAGWDLDREDADGDSLLAGLKRRLLG